LEASLGYEKIDYTNLKVNEATVHTPDLEDELVRMFVEIFPEDQRYAGFVRQRVRNAQKPNPKAISHQWVVKYQGEIVGFRLFSYLRRYNMGVSGYIAVSSDFRGFGIGKWIHQKTIEQVKADAAASGQPEPLGFCGEVDHPSAAHDEEDRQVRLQRIQIFKRMGAWVVDFGYLEPLKVEGMPIENEMDLAGLSPDPMLVYIVLFQPEAKPSKKVVSHMVKGMLLDTYHLNENNFFFNHAMQGIEKGLKFV
jgi:GNAT superfamily N-acetyltransferase